MNLELAFSDALIVKTKHTKSWFVHLSVVEVQADKENLTLEWRKNQIKSNQIKQVLKFNYRVEKNTEASLLSETGSEVFWVEFEFSLFPFNSKLWLDLSFPSDSIEQIGRRKLI